MLDKLKRTLPLALAFGVLTFVWIEVSMNFTFHWFDNGNLGNGLGLPPNLHLVAPAAFISWALVFAAGGDAAAATKVGVGSLIGAVAGLVLMAFAPKTAELPDFWGLALWAGVLAFGAVALSVFDWYYAPAALASWAGVVFWWIATGLDGWAAHGGGVGSGLESLGKPETAGTGAFGGVLSTPYEWVFASTLISLLAGCLLGYLTASIGGTTRRSHAGYAAREHARYAARESV
jgi:hypothetical protein